MRPRPGSPVVGTPGSRWPGRVHRWWRSSASPSSPLAIGRSTDSGRALIADAVELKYRLPQALGPHPEPVTCRCGGPAGSPRPPSGSPWRPPGSSMPRSPGSRTRSAPRALDRLVDEAIARFMPDQALEDAAQAAEGRHFTIHHQQVSFTGTSRIEGELDLADALDLDAALTRGAESLKAGGSTDSLDVRRSIAAGELARHQLALDLNTDRGRVDHPTRDEGQAAPGRPLRAPSESRASRGTSPASGWTWPGWRTTARSSPPTRSGPGAPTPTPRSSVKPVIDLNEHSPSRATRSPTGSANRPGCAPHLRVPLVHPTRPGRRLRPRHPIRPGRHHLLVQPRRPVPTPPSPENPLHLDLHRPGTRVVPVVEPVRLPVPHDHTAPATSPPTDADPDQTHLPHSSGTAPPPPTTPTAGTPACHPAHRRGLETLARARCSTAVGSH